MFLYPSQVRHLCSVCFDKSLEVKPVTEKDASSKQPCEMVVRLTWPESFGEKWMNEDNLALLLYSSYSADSKHLGMEVVEVVEPYPSASEQVIYDHPSGRVIREPGGQNLDYTQEHARQPPAPSEYNPNRQFDGNPRAG